MDGFVTPSSCIHVGVRASPAGLVLAGSLFHFNEIDHYCMYYSNTVTLQCVRMFVFSPSKLQNEMSYRCTPFTGIESCACGAAKRLGEFLTRMQTSECLTYQTTPQVI